MADNPIPMAIDPIWLRRRLVDYYSLEDIRTLCFDLGVDFDSLPGEGKDGKARELVIYCRNRAMIDTLVENARRARPQLEWLQTVGNDESGEDVNFDTPAKRIYALVKAFNFNRHQPLSSGRTRSGDEIAFKMRELAPELDGQFNVGDWLNSANIGKRVAAVEFLDWKQDTEYFNALLDRLFIDKPFIQFHILIALNSLLDQLSYDDMRFLRERLKDYEPEGDGSRKLWSLGLQKRVNKWFELVD